MKNPKVSILMTVFNHQKYIKSSINSILSQTFKNFEFIIIENGSTDKSGEIISKIKDKRIKLFKIKKNIGRTKGLNYGLKKCNGKYIVIQDSDDNSKKNRISIQYKFLEKNIDVALVASNYNIIDERNRIIKKQRFNSDLYKYPNKILFNNIIAHSTVMYHNKIIKEFGGYPKNFIYAQDYAFYLRVIKKYKIKLLNETLANLRINHKNSETFRLRRSSDIQFEEIKLIFWILKNIKTNFKEKFKIFFKVIITIVKIFRFYLS